MNEGGAASGVDTQKGRRRRRLWLLVAILAVSALVYYGPDLITISCGDTVIALGKSMEPTITNGDRLTIDRDAYLDSGPERGDIVLLTHKESQIVRNAKRVIGLPGETITIAGVVFVDGIQLEEPYLAPGTFTSSELKEFVVPENHYFVLGDNRPNSGDSRHWGPIPSDWISAKVLL
jgi:signal peptidase I